MSRRIVRWCLGTLAVVSLGMVAGSAGADDDHHHRRHHHHGHHHHYGGHHHHHGHHHHDGLSGFGFSRGGFSISIGGGYPYGYGYGGYGYPYSGYASSYRGYAPSYSTRSSWPLAYEAYPYGYGRLDSYPYDSGFRYDTAPPAVYGIPSYRSEYAHPVPVEPNYSSARPVSPSSDLQPGMILPDGSRVISVGPLGGPVDQSWDESESSEPAEVQTPQQSEDRSAAAESDQPAQSEELIPPPADEPVDAQPL